ncbi:MAG: transposase [Deltaproteobacteria bacterium]|nr:transposase [Deltaproteobacteria bacterium]
MARPLRIEYAHAHYHVTCRGNDRRKIFSDDDDRRAFLERLRKSLEIYDVRLHAYVLMHNHFHLMVETPGANLSEFMRHFNVAYTSFFNRRHRRTGHLYQGRFKAILFQPDRHLLTLSRYVHMNPVRVLRRRPSVPEQVRQLWLYPWSSLGGYVSARRRESWIHYDAVLAHVRDSRQRYGRFVQDGLEQGVPAPWKAVRGQVVLGDHRFWAAATEHRPEAAGAAPGDTQPRRASRLAPARITAEVADHFQLPPARLRRKRGRCRDQRGLLMELMYRHAGMTQQTIGAYLGGLDYTAVSHERRRVRERMAEDPTLAKDWRDIESRLEDSVGRRDDTDAL